jgi:hypothetical protein
VLTELSKQHDVTVYRFDQLARPIQIASLARPTSITTATDSQTESQLRLLSRAHTLMLAACFLGVVALLLIAISFGTQIVGAHATSAGAGSLFSGSTLALAAMLLLAFAILPASDYPLAALFQEPEQAVKQYETPADELNAPLLTQVTNADAEKQEAEKSGTQLPADWRAASCLGSIRC